ncbi:hypothetical protein GTS_48440 [Gandjariella thermophila]|uniref:Uncharacterized protein n=1 Tax=Gandjariella thermophila TaxID=1931992 RepID=A0A4D4J970_9PSEU|nr:hypothetical protein GTS_48440 [Gandjariella thermophila]
MNGCRSAAGELITAHRKPKENVTMLLYEDLARARMREVREAVGDQRLARRLQATRRWRWLAGWAARRAARAAALL